MNVTFFMEQHIGHHSYYENLRRGVEVLPNIRSQWVEVTYESGDQRAGLKLFPKAVRGPFTGRAQVLDGLARYPADVVFFNTQAPAVLGGRAVGARPYVLATDITPIQYDAMGEHYAHRKGQARFVAAMKHRANVRLLKRAARLVPWSNWVHRSLIEDYGVDPERIEVVFPGVDLDFWQPVERPESAGAVRLLFVGGDFFRKGGPLLLDAFRALAPGEAELVLVTRTAIPAEPGIEVHNSLRANTAEMLAVYQSCDIFVLPSSAEAFGIAAVEASAMGLPIIATSVGGLQDIVTEGQTGFLIADGDLEALTRHLRDLIANRQLRRQMGHAARCKAEACFDARRNAARIVEILFDSASASSERKSSFA